MLFCEVDDSRPGHHTLRRNDMKLTHRMVSHLLARLLKTIIHSLCFVPHCKHLLAHLDERGERVNFTPLLPRVQHMEFGLKV